MIFIHIFIYIYMKTNYIVLQSYIAILKNSAEEICQTKEAQHLFALHGTELY